MVINFGDTHQWSDTKGDVLVRLNLLSCKIAAVDVYFGTINERCEVTR
jgi:hypothetical protein